jgi:hypothetical protein
MHDSKRRSSRLRLLAICGEAIFSLSLFFYVTPGGTKDDVFDGAGRLTLLAIVCFFWLRNMNWARWTFICFECLTAIGPAIALILIVANKSPHLVLGIVLAVVVTLYELAMALFAFAAGPPLPSIPATAS